MGKQGKFLEFCKWDLKVAAHKITGGQRSLTTRNLHLTADIVSLTFSIAASVFLAIPPSLQESSGIFLSSLHTFQTTASVAAVRLIFWFERRQMYPSTFT